MINASPYLIQHYGYYQVLYGHYDQDNMLIWCELWPQQMRYPPYLVVFDNVYIISATLVLLCNSGVIEMSLTSRVLPVFGIY